MLPGLLRRSVFHVSRLQHWKLGGIQKLIQDRGNIIIGCRTFRTAPASMKNLKVIRRDQYRRRCVAEYEKERLRLKAMIKNKLLPEVVQQKAKETLTKHPSNASITRVRNRCVVSGRGRGVIKDFGLTRMKFRKLADYGLLSGVTRSTW